MDSFPLDQRSGKYGAENRRPRPRFELLHIDSARQVIKFVLRETLDAESVGGFLRKDEEEVREVVFLDETFPRLEQIFLPIPRRIRWRRRCALSHFSPIAVPGGNLDNRRNAELARDAKRLQAIPRPTVEKIVTAGRKMPRRDPIEILLFRPVIIRPLEERNEPDRMPAQRIDQPRVDFLL